MSDQVLAPSVTRHAPNGMVCTIDHLASQAGVRMLSLGGSAADAAVAANAVLAVTSQHACGMGGDLFALVHDGRDVHALDASGRAGSGADPERLRAEGHSAIPPRGDVRAVTIPGCVDGWTALHDRFGRLPLAEVLRDAADYAEKGFPASPSLSASVASIATSPEALDFTSVGPLRPGVMIRRPGLAAAIRDISAGGRAAWYEGEFGARLVELGAGEYSPEDLASSHAEWVHPLAVEAWGHRIWSIPPGSQGYLILAAAWIADGLDLPDDPADPRWAHLLVEAARMAAFDRPDVLYAGADGGALIDPARLGPRRRGVDPERAALLPGSFGAGDTTYLCAVDADRMGVSLIQSNAAGFGSGLAIPGIRVFLQNRGLGFNLRKGHPAEYGPGRRPPHTLAPALVTTPDGQLHSVLGTMGGDAQPQIVLQLLARLLVANASPAAALGAGRWALSGTAAGAGGFDTWDDGGEVSVRVEGHASAEWDAGLAARGHNVERKGSWDSGFGHAQLITVDHAGGVLAGATDPRPRTGAAAGF